MEYTITWYIISVIIIILLCCIIPFFYIGICNDPYSKEIDNIFLNIINHKEKIIRHGKYRTTFTYNNKTINIWTANLWYALKVDNINYRPSRRTIKKFKNYYATALVEFEVNKNLLGVKYV